MKTLLVILGIAALVAVGSATSSVVVPFKVTETSTVPITDFPSTAPSTSTTPTDAPTDPTTVLSTDPGTELVTDPPTDAPTEPTTKECPLFYSAWPLDAEGTDVACLRIMPELLTWNQHRTGCLDEGQGYALAIIPTYTQVKLANYFPTVDDYREESFFLGATDLYLEGTWYWDDRTIMNNAFWQEGEPNGGVDENCLCQCPTTFQLCDCACEAQHMAVCEYFFD